MNPDTNAVIFDMDGVLVDTEPLYRRANAVTFQNLGFSVSDLEYDAFVGLDASKMWGGLKAKHSLVHSVQELIAIESSGLKKALDSHPIPVLPGIPVLLETLKNADIPIALASSSPMENIHLVLEKSGLGAYFQVKASGEEVRRGKPAPDIFRLAARRLGAKPGACTVIEDSAAGTQGAKAAGMACVGFYNPHSGNQDLSPADLQIRAFGSREIAQILALVQASPIL